MLSVIVNKGHHKAQRIKGTPSAPISRLYAAQVNRRRVVVATSMSGFHRIAGAVAGPRGYGAVSLI